MEKLRKHCTDGGTGRTRNKKEGQRKKPRNKRRDRKEAPKLESAATQAGGMTRPRTRDELRDWVRRHTGMTLPLKGTCAGHCTPLDYLEHVFFERGETGDTVVWACRGGGKTMIGAVATLLDLLFKPGIQVRILGGSKEQSEKMYLYLCGLVRERFEDQIQGKVMRRGFALINGSRVEILTQSETSVRGTRVQKMRCDELELFDDKVWDAAQLTTRSMWVEEKHETRNMKLETGEEQAEACSTNVRGAVEVFSTMHRPSGLMSKLVARATCPLSEMPRGALETGTPRKIFAWCIWDVVERCDEKDRRCEGCELLPECQSRAREAAGFVPIEDAFRFHQRSSQRTWEQEMLCKVPYPQGQVFRAFRRAVHVRQFPASRVEAGQTVTAGGRSFRVESLIAGIDYGWQKFVCLWLAMLRDDAGRRAVWAVDEYAVAERPLHIHAAAIVAREAWKSEAAWKPAAYYGDVAGRAHDSHTGQSSEQLLKKSGIVVKSRAMRIEESVAAIDQLIEPAENAGLQNPEPRFFVDPRCANLIEALCQYEQKDGEPVKDGEHDHLIDALRYAIVGHDGGGGGKVEVRGY